MKMKAPNQLPALVRTQRRVTSSEKLASAYMQSGAVARLTVRPSSFPARLPLPAMRAIGPGGAPAPGFFL